MKKLMMAAAIVCAAVAAQAGSIKWTCYDVMDPSNSEQVFLGGSAYLFLGTTVEGVADAIKAGTWTTDGKIATASFDGELGEDQWNEIDKLVDGYTGVQKGYMVLFDTEDYTKANYFMVSDDIVTTAEIGQTGFKPMAFTSQMTTWQSVPEPTSGLLLLLGVAGLALRRRRA